MHLLLLPPLVLLLFIPIVSSPEPTCITLAVFQHDSLRVSLAASSAPHHVFRLFAAIPIPVPPPLPAVFRLHLQPLWLRHRRGRRARHRCRRSKGQTVQTIALDVRHVTADVLCSTEQLRLSWESTFSPCVHPCGCCSCISSPPAVSPLPSAMQRMHHMHHSPPSSFCYFRSSLGSPSPSFSVAFIHQITCPRTSQ